MKNISLILTAILSTTLVASFLIILLLAGMTLTIVISAFLVPMAVILVPIILAYLVVKTVLGNESKDE